MTHKRRIKLKRGQVATIVTSAAVTSAAVIAEEATNTAQAQTNPDGASTSSAASGMKVYQLPAGEAEVFIEAIHPPVALVIFGSGHDAMPVVRLAKERG